jgi:molybdopterin-binding protein
MVCDVPQFRISEVASLLGVSDDTVRRWAEAGRFPTRRAENGRLVVEGRDLAAFAQKHAHSPDVSLTARSARNTLTGLVTRVIVDGVMAQVDLQCGPFRVVSLMSREAVEELGLEPGVLAVASIKATQVVVEVPDTSRELVT